MFCNKLPSGLPDSRTVFFENRGDENLRKYCLHLKISGKLLRETERERERECVRERE